MRRLAWTLARLALGLALASGAPGCKKSSSESLPTGAWQSDDGLLLLRIFPSGQVSWYFTAGGGSCVFLATGTIDFEGAVLVSEFDDSYPYALSGDELRIDDATGELGGSFTKVELETVCFVHVPPLEVESARVVPLTLGDEVEVQGGVGRAVSLEVPAGAVSFGLYAFGDVVGTEAAFGALFSPGGVDVLDEKSAPPFEAESDIQFCTLGFCSVVVPKETNILPEGGTWTGVVVANTAADLGEVSLRGIVRGASLSATTFSVRAFLTTSLVPSAEIEAVLDEVAALFGSMYGVTLSIEPITTLSGPELLVQDVLQPDTAALMGLGDPDAINLFFAERLLGVGGILGIASGIPASHGVAGPFDGLLVHLGNHLDGGGGLVPGLLVETVAHEIGHLLGLYHPTESDAAFFDPIADTPECPLLDPDPLVVAHDHDLDMDGTIYADECWDAGGDNLMFWTPSTTTGASVLQRALSAGQLFVIERSLASP